MDFYETKKELEDIFLKIKELKNNLDIPNLEKRIQNIERESLKEDFWEKEDSKNLLKEKSDLENKIHEMNHLEIEITDLKDLIEISEEEFSKSEEETDFAKDILRAFNEFKKKYDAFTIKELLSGKHDKQNAILTIHAGSGGTEAMDWAEMLLRMYMRYAEDKGFKISLLDKNDDVAAGIKSATLLIKGDYAYGFLKNEKGVHRLVRISPFDSNKRRHTSFAAVDITPEMEIDKDIEIDSKDIRIDTFRSSGAGGQHVNKTDSAIRITHFPTGIVVSVQNERSQHQNKEVAMKILTSKLQQLKEEEHKESIAELQGKYNEITWGSQIRSYVFMPYTLVKDHRTNVENTNIEKVMDGDLDLFIYEKLKTNN
ncbi:MAG: peptide chain release factor 2 [Clostridiales Family XIII bacterium]|jgi:peptide chain release factor 2|nr:peptide chain release factor 2 [Clostridiales Family XIII bacterium]